MNEEKSVSTLDILNIVYSLSNLVLTVAVIFIAFGSNASVVSLRVWTITAACVACLAFVIAYMESAQPDTENSFTHQRRFKDALVNIGQSVLLLVITLCA